MNWLDGTIFSVIALGAFFGAVSGLFWQVARVVMIGVGTLGALRWGGWASDILANRFSEDVASVFGYTLVFLFVYLASWCISFVIDQGIRASELKMADRAAGAAFGGAKALLAVVVVLAGMSIYPTPEFQADMKGSLAAPAILGAARTVMPEAAKSRIQLLLDESKKRLEPLYGVVR